MTQRRLADVEIADFELTLEPLSETQLRLALTTVSRHDGSRSERTFEGSTCVDVTDAAAVAIALTIGSPRDEAAAKAAPAGGAEVTILPTKSPKDEPAPRPAVAAPVLSFRVGANAALDSSATPEVVPGGALRFSLVASKLRAELEGALYVPGQAANARGEGGTFQLAYAAPLLCAQKALGRPSALLCLGYELGQLSAEGEGVAEPRSRRTLWHGPRTELGASWALSKDWSLMGRLGGVLALSRPAFVLDAPQTVHRAGLLSLRAALGVELTL